MTHQEREQLTQLLEQMTQARVAQKDGDADTLIREACSRQPDAAYLLALKAMLMEHALQETQAQISALQREIGELRNQTRNVESGASFLDANAWGNTPRPVPSAQPAQYARPSAPAPVPAAAPAASAWGGTSMLGSIAATAAGVVAGGFLFQGIEHLLGNHSSASGLTNGLSADSAVDRQTAIDAPADNGANDFFDTSSVDDFIASDADDIA